MVYMYSVNVLSDTTPDRSRRRFLLAGAATAVAAGCSDRGRSGDPAATTTTAAGDASVDELRPSPNPYLSGNLAPVPWETTAPVLEVEGALPPELEGTLLRNGPNPISANPETYHWFMGDGLLHAITLTGGTARYRSRWVRTDAASAALGEEPIAGQPPEASVPTSAANTNVIHHAGRLLALYEVCLPTEVTAEAGTVGRYDFGGALRSPMTAHPKLDPETGELVFFGLDFVQQPHLRYHVADAAGRLVTSTEVPIDRPTMMHDFGVTRTRVVFLDLPVVYDLGRIGRHPFPAAWVEGAPAHVGVMDRTGGDVRWIEIEPCFVHHVANAFDDGDRVVVDLVRHPRALDTDPYGPSDGQPRLQRWTIDPARGTVDQQQISDVAIELPRVDPRSAMSSHGAVYGADMDFDGTRPVLGGLRRFGLPSGELTDVPLWDGAAAGEAIMVPGEGGGADEGWLLSVVYDRPTDRSVLIVLDTTDLAGGPVAKVHLPTRVPMGFHGSWVPASA